MSAEILHSKIAAHASAVMRGEDREVMSAKGRYEVVCLDNDGNVKWTEVIDNLVTTVGKNHIMDTYLGGSGYTASLAVGLVGVGTPAITDTQASHGGWLEVGGANAPVYTGNRPVPSFSAASADVKQTSGAMAFAMTSAGNVAGCFLNAGGSMTKDATSGVLFSAGLFATGTRAVLAGDTLNVTYSLSV